MGFIRKCSSDGARKTKDSLIKKVLIIRLDQFLTMT
jgi:hypothetical protein